VRLTLSTWLIAMAHIATAGAPEISVWGDDAFALKRPARGLLFREEGTLCAIEADGATCYLAQGEVDWEISFGRDVVTDYVSGTDDLVLFTEVGTWRIALGSGRAVQVDDDLDFIPTANGGLVEVGPQDIPDDDDVTQIIATPTGDLGVIMQDGTLSWLGDSPHADRIATEVDTGGGVHAIPTDFGWVIIDAHGAVLIDLQGHPYSAIDGPILDAATFTGGLLIADGSAVTAVDALDGTDAGVAIDWPATLVAATPDLRHLAAVSTDAARVLVWRDGELIGNTGHHAPVVRLAPGPNGGLLSLDSDGVAIQWGPDGAGEVLEIDVLDAAFDPTGGVWLARPEQLERRTSTSRVDISVAVHELAAAPFGVIARSSDGLRAYGVDGTERWRRPAAPTSKLVTSGDLFLLAGPERLEVFDSKTGTRRRNIAVPDVHMVDGGEAVGGLIGAGWRGSTPVAGRPPALDDLPHLGPVDEGPWLSPNGRWALWLAAGRQRIVITDMKGYPLLSEPTGGSISTAATGHHTVWLGRQDGKVERWEVGPFVEDAPLPAFDSYAQLEPFVPHAIPTEAPDVEARGPIRALVALADGASAYLFTTVATRDRNGSFSIHTLPDDQSPVAIAATRSQGLAVLTSTGEVWMGFEQRAPKHVGRTSVAGAALCASGDELLVGGPNGAQWLKPGKRARDAAGAPEQPIEQVVCSQGGEWVAALAGGEVTVWTPKTGVRLAVLRQGAPISSISRGAPGLLTGGEDEVVGLWESSRWTLVGLLEGHEGPIRAIAPTPDGRWLLSATTTRAFVWDPAIGATHQTVDLPAPVIEAIFDGTHFVLAMEGGRVMRIAGPHEAIETIGAESETSDEPVDVAPPALTPSRPDGSDPRIPQEKPIALPLGSQVPPPKGR
jgi:hypothetical protein